LQITIISASVMPESTLDFWTLQAWSNLKNLVAKVSKIFSILLRSPAPWLPKRQAANKT